MIIKKKWILIKLFWFLKESVELGIRDYLPVFKEWNAWADVRSCIDYTLKPWEIVKIPLWFWLELQEWTYARVEWRSWNAAKFGIDTIGNIIDPSYRWEIHAILVNNWKEDFMILKWDRVAQIIISEFIPVTFFVSDELTKTSRWEKWFGSSWIK